MSALKNYNMKSLKRSAKHGHSHRLQPAARATILMTAQGLNTAESLDDALRQSLFVHRMLLIDCFAGHCSTPCHVACVNSDQG